MFNFTKYLAWLPRFYSRRNQIILIGGAVLLAAVAIGVIYYFYFYPYRDSLLAKAPIDSAAYVHFNLPRSVPLEAGLVRGLPNGVADYQRLNLEPLFRNLDQWFDWPAGQFAKDILPLAGREMALVVVPWQNEKDELKLAPALLINLSRQAQSEISPTQLEVLGLFYSFPNKRQLVIAGSTVALEKITGTAEVNNLKNLATVKRGLARLNRRSLVKGYLAIEELDKYYKQKTTPQNWSDFSHLLARLSADFLLRQNNRQIYFSVSSTNDGFNFKINGLADSPAFKPLAGRRLIKFIPTNTLMVFSGLNWRGLIESLEKSFPATGSGLEPFKMNYEKLYRFDWQKDLVPLLSGPGELIVMKNEPRNDFIITTELPVVQVEQLDKLKEIVREYLAYRQPTEKAKILPDKSRVTELIADPTKFNWQSAELDGLTINFIKETEPGFEFLYTLLGDQLIFSNSLEQFKIFLRQQKEPSPDWLNFNQATRAFWLARGDETVLLNLRDLPTAPFPRELLKNFNYLAIVNTRSGVSGSIY
ncbi:MAG: DUF3352 domain-containing protein [bacterium]